MKHFAVIGNPISHSKSPQIMNAALAHHGIHAYYTRVLLDQARAFDLPDRLISFSGCNVTAPFKKEMLKIAGERSEEVIQTGVTNTLVKQENQHWKAFNTDVSGAIMPFVNRWQTLENKKILLIGAGGASRAAIVGLLGERSDVSIVNRTESKGRTLAEEFGCKSLSLLDLRNKVPDFDGIINTAPVLIDELKDFVPRDGQLVLDASYQSSPFKQFYKKSDIGYIDGKEWLLEQAIVGFRHFTGKVVDKKILNKALLKFHDKSEGIYLIGPMGAGKTTIGSQIAKISGYQFWDLDAMIEQMEGLSINKIFSEKGEEYFRYVEYNLLKKVSGKRNVVISCGGGIITREKSRKILESKHSVLLLVDPATSIKRITTDDRPLLRVEDPILTISHLLEERMDHYLRAAHVVVNAENPDPVKTAELIWKDFQYCWQVK